MVLSDRDILRLHVEAVWGVRLPPIDLNTIELLPESAYPSWKLYVAELADERIYVWRPDVGATEREAWLAQVPSIFTQGPALAPSFTISCEVILAQRASPKMSIAMAQHIARPLVPDDRDLVEAFSTGAADNFFRADLQPCIGVIVEGRLLSMAHSARRTAEACELGIDTLPEARRRGYALAATVLWAAVVAQEGLLPLYSAFANNIASLRLAAAAGYRAFARGVSMKTE